MADDTGPPPGDETVPEVLLDRMTDAFIGLDREGRITYLNERAWTMVGPAIDDAGCAADLEGDVVWDVLPRGRETALYGRFDDAVESGDHLSYEEYYAPLDAWFEVRLYPSDTGVSVYFRDVTERREQRERLVRREAALRDLYEVVARTDRTFEQRVDALLDHGRDFLGTEYGTLSRVTDDEYAFEFATGANDAVGTGDTVSLLDTYCECVVTDEETLVVGDVEAERPDIIDRAGYTDLGITAYVGTPVYVDGEVYGTLCFYGSETHEDGFTEWETTLVELMGRWLGTALERRRTAAELTRQNERLERFAEVLSHDLRNPLQVAYGNVQLARREGDSDPLRSAEDAIDRMERMVTDILSLATAGERPDEFQQVGLEPAAREAWEGTREESATLSLDAPGTVEADRDHLLRVFENLFRNSVEHTDDPVTVTVTALEDGPGTDGFAVCDDGSGIPPDERSRVFEHGYTGSREGTGYGLSIVAEVAETHGWTVTLGESASGGTRVAFDVS